MTKKLLTDVTDQHHPRGTRHIVGVIHKHMTLCR